MTIDKLRATGLPIQPLGIEDFRNAALGNEDQVQFEGKMLKLLGTGQTPSARSFAWVDHSEITRMFVAALESSFGAPLSQAIANELGLSPPAGKPLTSRLVTLALGMAETAGPTLAGAEFAKSLKPEPPAT